MLILRILLKTALLPVIVLFLVAKLIVKIGMQIFSEILGGMILFVASCIIYTITKQTWSQILLLVLIEGGIMGVTICTGILERLVDTVLRRIIAI